MPWRGKVTAYLVIPFVRADDGLWVQESETICFDHDLAVEMAEDDSAFSAWVVVYPLDRDGARLTGRPIACYGDLDPLTETPPGGHTSRPMAPPPGSPSPLELPAAGASAFPLH